MKMKTSGQGTARGRVSDAYDDVELPYPDAEVAEKLCIEWSLLLSVSK
jgi:hypothetical protein